MCSSNLPLAGETTQTETSIVIVVLSCRKNFVQRNLIRQTYGSIRNMNNVHILAVVFMLGSMDAPDVEKTDFRKVEAERVQFGDVIVGNFVDTYRNLSRKSIMAYNWLTAFCQNADIVVKTDDDVLLNIFKLTEELGKWTASTIRSFTIYCAIHWNEEIVRDESSVYYVSPEEYSGAEKFPMHCAGVGYVTSIGVIRKIADEISKSFQGSVCTHEDVFMTGIVPEKINSAGKELVKFINRNDEWIFYISENSVYDDAQYILKMIKQSPNETVDFNEFGKQSGTGIFYLLEHTENFEEVYMRLWYLVKSSYLNENMATDTL